ncbi:MAG: 60 kDa chaperonin [Firmicutes bacterium]|nr:60 kDa chaperonin [candidate division NPL-UPA2 bacterium]
MKAKGLHPEGEQKHAALLTNSAAVQAIVAAVEGTMGPKGLDTMLVDRFGEVVITNAGVTILEKMQVNHPAARMLIKVAKAQQEEIGDGTTTATLMAGTLVAEGVNHVVRGVPVARVIEGMRIGIQRGLESLQRRSRSVDSLDSPLLERVAYISGREHADIAALVVRAARLIGSEKLKERSFKLADTIRAEAGVGNEVFMGVIVSKGRLNKQMPHFVTDARILVLDDALEPEGIEEEALATESGFKKYLELQADFQGYVRKIVDLGVTVCLLDRGMHDLAEEMLTDAGVLVISRVASHELQKVCDHTGAKAVKRTALRRSKEELARYLGEAHECYEDESLRQVRFLGGVGKPMATVAVGAATAEIVGERERIAKDAASSLQAAVRGGYVPGGGAVEIALAKDVERQRDITKGMAAYGVDCVIAALRRPLAQIVQNAGFNPLEKVEDVSALQLSSGSDSVAINCDTGEAADMLALGVVDPTLVKLHAVKAAGEVALAILRIDTIIKMTDGEG